ncbi:fungal hydrophobin-domain-containing protein [Scleroderma yunnanense]
MLARTSTLFALALTAVTTAVPHSRGHEDGGHCNTGNLTCCNAVQSAEDPQTSQIAGILNIPISALNGNIGIACLSLDILALLNQQSCTQQPVCCENTEANGLVGIGCIPINLNL